MAFGISLHIWGDFALFTRPEMKVERVTYDVITPSAARGVLEAVYWKPQICWVIDRIHVLRPLRYASIRRNEVGCKASAANARKAMNAGRGSLGIAIEDERQQRAAIVLRDVGYVIDAHFDVLDHDEPPAKHHDIFRRRAEKGQCFHRPYLGCREFAAGFALVDGDMPPSELPAEQRSRDFGWMLHDIDFANGMTPRFFHARMVDGTITVPPFRSTEVRA